jgi:hypothetical protein
MEPLTLGNTGRRLDRFETLLLSHVQGRPLRHAPQLRRDESGTEGIGRTPSQANAASMVSGSFSRSLPNPFS